MKKFLFCLLAIMLVVCCVGCGNSDDEIICSACGEAFENTAKFCPNCGESVSNSQTNGGGNNESNDNSGDDNNNPNEDGITVNSSKEFLNAIGDNKKIVLNDGTYNLYGLTGINNTKVKKILLNMLMTDILFQMCQIWKLLAKEHLLLQVEMKFGQMG